MTRPNLWTNVVKKIVLNIFQFSQKDDYGRTPEYINRRKKEMAEAQKEYDAYVQVIDDY